MIRVEALPGGVGDCLWISWDAADGEHRILVDGGHSYDAALRDRIAAQPADARTFDLVVCSHVDNDHILGLLPLFAQPPAGFAAADVWFNARHHLLPLDALGTPSGDLLTTALVAVPGQQWNQAFGGRAVVVPDSGDLPTRHFPELTVTVLAPGRAQLAALLATWPETAPAPVEETDGPADRMGGETGDLATLARARFDRDPSVPNGSSIVLLLTGADGERVLLTADAHADVLLAGLRRLQTTGRIPVTLATVPHHGSARNTSPALVDALDCRHWLVSSNGRGNSRHPSRTAMARLLTNRNGPVLWFNYRSVENAEFALPSVRMHWGSSTRRPAASAPPGIRLVVTAGGVTAGDPAAVDVDG
jgi:hypothetical protein